MRTPIDKIKGVGPRTAEILAENGYKSAEDLAATKIEALGKIHGFGPARAKLVIKAAQALCDSRSAKPASYPNLENASQTVDKHMVGGVKVGGPAVGESLEKKGKSKKKSKKKTTKKKDKKKKKEEKKNKKSMKLTSKKKKKKNK